MTGDRDQRVAQTCPLGLRIFRPCGDNQSEEPQTYKAGLRYALRITGRASLEANGRKTADGGQVYARSFFATSPEMSVRRKSRPWNLYVSLV